MSTSKDTIYAKQKKAINTFRFDEEVTRVFEDMIKRSVPGYTLMLEMLSVISAKYITEESQCYDLGCSLGASTLAIQHNAPANSLIIAIDNSEAMIEQCKKNISDKKDKAKVDVRQQDILCTDFFNASLVSMNFTLQFINEDDRIPLLTKIVNSLNKGGALILSEKIVFDEPAKQERLANLHHDFKRSQGYSDLEIAQKRTSLENFLIPDTIQKHQQRLLDVGFSEVNLWFQCFNFVSLLAIK